MFQCFFFTEIFSFSWNWDISIPELNFEEILLKKTFEIRVNSKRKCLSISYCILIVSGFFFYTWITLRSPYACNHRALSDFSLILWMFLRVLHFINSFWTFLNYKKVSNLLFMMYCCYHILFTASSEDFSFFVFIRTWESTHVLIILIFSHAINSKTTINMSVWRHIA